MSSTIDGRAGFPRHTASQTLLALALRGSSPLGANSSTPRAHQLVYRWSSERRVRIWAHSVAWARKVVRLGQVVWGR